MVNCLDTDVCVLQADNRAGVALAMRQLGPYPNGYAVRDSIQILQKVFKLRTCEDSVFEHRERACLLYQIKRCSGPCVGHISQEDYRADVNQAATFLNGKTDELTQVLHHKMNRAADMLNFEEAAKYRDQIQALGVIPLYFQTALVSEKDSAFQFRQSCFHFGHFVLQIGQFGFIFFYQVCGGFFGVAGFGQFGGKFV